jgi:hypothetical protein
MKQSKPSTTSLPLETQELLHSYVCGIDAKRYGFPICWAVHTIPMANQPIESDKPSVGEGYSAKDYTNSWDSWGLA